MEWEQLLNHPTVQEKGSAYDCCHRPRKHLQLWRRQLAPWCYRAALRGFHGRTMGALSATWEPHYREPFAPLVPDVSHIRYNDLAAARAAINEQTAAVIIELVQGEGGVHVASDEYVRGLAALCRE